MKPPQARVYLEGVVLGAVREDITNTTQKKDHRKLNIHYYESLKRALYKPAAFFKGIVFPLLDVSKSDLCIKISLETPFIRMDARSRKQP